MNAQNAVELLKSLGIPTEVIEESQAKAEEMRSVAKDAAAKYKAQLVLSVTVLAPGFMKAIAETKGEDKATMINTLCDQLLKIVESHFVLGYSIALADADERRALQADADRDLAIRMARPGSKLRLLQDLGDDLKAGDLVTLRSVQKGNPDYPGNDDQTYVTIEESFRMSGLLGSVVHPAGNLILGARFEVADVGSAANSDQDQTADLNREISENIGSPAPTAPSFRPW